MHPEQRQCQPSSCWEMASVWPLGGLGLEKWKAGFWGYWCLHPSLDVTSAESILASAVSTPAAWDLN